MWSFLVGASLGLKVVWRRVIIVNRWSWTGLSMTKAYTIMSHVRAQVSIFLHRRCCSKCRQNPDNFSLSDKDLSRAVDLQVIKQRSNVPSESTDSRKKDFRSNLLLRDVC